MAHASTFIEFCNYTEKGRGIMIISVPNRYLVSKRCPSDYLSTYCKIILIVMRIRGSLLQSMQSPFAARAFLFLTILQLYQNLYISLWSVANHECNTTAYTCRSISVVRVRLHAYTFFILAADKPLCHEYTPFLQNSCKIDDLRHKLLLFILSISIW